MRSDPADYELLTPGNLQAALRLMAEQKKEWLPIAGGTDVMVQFAAGILGNRKLLSIWNLPELRRIEVLPEEVQIGAGCTYTDLREHQLVAREFSLLALAASWTGGIANQNRGTLGGNIVNASPAADSLPALLAYDAELRLVSVRGERRIAYRDFHTGYKKMNLAEDELIRTVCLPRKFSGHVSYARKVGARSTQAISKVCIAALARVEKGTVQDARIALGSVAPTPIRLAVTERVLNGNLLDPALVVLSQKAAVNEVSPISDIRSTATYRAAVVSNLVAEFLNRLGEPGVPAEGVLARWNQISPAEAEEEILACCGSRAWAMVMASRRPVPSEAALLAASDDVWLNLSTADWMEAFRSHPRIGESRAEQGSKQNVEQRSTNWSGQEQSGVANENDSVKRQLRALNREYEKRFGYIFIVCATAKSAADILDIMQRRLQNEAQTELRESAEQQRQITHIRLKKWLSK